MKDKSTTSKLLAILVVIGIASCGQQANKEKVTDNSKAFNQAEREVKHQIQSVAYDIPPPSEIPFILQATGAEFNESLINDLNKVDEYEITNNKSALNLGVYSTDIGYLVSYEKVQEALNYMSSTKRLADHLKVSTAININLLERFENNLGNKDSLAFIINEAIGQTDQFLKDDDRATIAALLITGSFVEGLYISTGLVKTYPKDLLPKDTRNLILAPLVRAILEQNKALNDLVKLLGAVEQTQLIEDIKKQLMELQELYTALNIEDEIQNNQSNLILTDSTLVNITIKVEEIRAKITK